MIRKKADSYYQEIILVLAVMLVVVLAENLTAYVTDDVSVNLSVRDRTDGRYSAFNFNQTIFYWDRQYVDVEFHNSGTNNYSSSIELRIYRLVGTFLNLSATYQDSTVQLFPSDRRSFSAVYTNNITGIYFIQARTSYGTRTLEQWQSFTVVNQTVPTPGNGTGNETGGGGNVTIIPGPSGGSTFIPGPDRTVFRTITPLPAELNISAPDNVNVRRGEAEIVDVHVTNIGKANLSNIRITISSPAELDVEINPKTIPRLGVNSSAIFLITVRAPADADLGSHIIDYFIVADEITRSGTVRANVLAEGVSQDEIAARILNYEILIADISEQILHARLDGFRPDQASLSLNRAKANLESARRSYDAGDFSSALERLDDTRDDIEDSVFLLAISMIILTETAVIDLFWLIIILFLTAFITFIYFYRRRKKKLNTRPRILREATEE